MANYNVPHLCRRGHVFYFRMPFRPSLAHLVGRRELKLSLKTSNPALARMRCRLFSARFEQLIAGVERMPGLTPDAIQKCLRDYYASCLAEASEIAFLVPEDARADPEAEISWALASITELRHLIARREYDPEVQRTARELVTQAGMKVPARNSETFDALCSGVLRARAEQRRVLVALLRGETDKLKPADVLFDGIIPQGLPPLPGEEGAGPNISIGTVASKYQTVKSNADEWVGKTAADHKRVLDLFCELAGASKPVTLISADDMREFRDALQALPPNYMKQTEFAGKSAAEVIKICAATKEHPQLSPRTQRKYLEMLRSFLKWAIDEGHLDKMPAPNLKFKIKANAQDARHPFSEDQLKKLFASPQYTGHLSDHVRSRPGKLIKRDGRYWIPLVALFSGMRLGEIVQLLVTDVKHKDEVWYFSVSTGESDEKHLKTASSKRKVPVHPVLVTLGLLDFVKERHTADPNGRIFSDVKKGKDGYFSHNFSKWFGRYLKQIDVKTARTSFHSFRHNFKDALVAGHVQDTHIKALLGHADRSVTASYGSPIDVGLLASDVVTVHYELPKLLCALTNTDI